LWSVSKVDLKAITRTVKAGAPLNLFYDDAFEKWQAEIDGKDFSAKVDPAKANRLLDHLMNLNVSRWLLPSDEKAAAALESPLLTIIVSQEAVNEVGDVVGLDGSILTTAASPDDPNIFYGRLSDEPNPFILDRETFMKIALDPLER
jgi:hypothetical protein